jgi:molybdate transport system substrate-binding protein
MRWLILLLTPLVFLFSCNQKRESLEILTAAGLKEPLTELAEEYKKQHPNVELNLIFAGSGELLTQLSQGRGDIFIPAAEYYMKVALKRGLIIPETVKVVGKHIPVLVVRKEKANTVRTFYDLKTANVRLGIGDPKVAAIGKISYRILERAKLLPYVEKKITVKTPTVNQLLIYLNSGQIDAAIVWKELTEKLKRVVVIPIPTEVNVVEKIEVGVAKRTGNLKAAEQFEEFLIGKGIKF